MTSDNHKNSKQQEKKRVAVPKRIRFEVFKRDKFTCQYCGGKSPDVVLNCDHIDPVANGGTNDILNLITSCQPCNSGKSDKLLNDSSVLDKQRMELEKLSDRREQINMMMAWREELSNLIDIEIGHISDQINQKCPEYSVSDAGKKFIKRWLKKYSFSELLEAIDDSFDSYHSYCDEDECVHSKAWDKAFRYVPNVARIRKSGEKSEELRRVFYIRGILRNRIPYVNEGRYMAAMKEAIDNDINLDGVENLSKNCRNWTEFIRQINLFNEGAAIQ